MLPETGGAARAAIPLCGMKVKAAPDAVDGRPYCLSLTSSDEDDEEEEEGRKRLPVALETGC